VEASALQAPAGIARTRISVGAPLLRLRSDEQLVALFRAGSEEAFRAIHDRYRHRLFAYARQMLPGSRQDAEDALQDIFVRAYGGLRSSNRELALRAWLYRISHNRCIDELRRAAPPPPEVLHLVRAPVHDPVEEAERRESLRRLIADVRRLPDQQRSALLMRELGGMPYAELAAALGVSVPAVKSLLVRARVGLAQALEARDTACGEIRAELVVAHDRGVRPSGLARRHMHECVGCREFRGGLRRVSRQFAALTPALGPLGLIAKLLGIGGGAAAGSGTAAGGAAVTGGAAASAGAVVSGAGHVASLLAAAVVTAGGAVELQSTIGQGAHHRPAHHAPARAGGATSPTAPAAFDTAARPATDAGAIDGSGAAPADQPKPASASAAGKVSISGGSSTKPIAPGTSGLDPSGGSGAPTSLDGGGPGAMGSDTSGGTGVNSGPGGLPSDGVAGAGPTPASPSGGPGAGTGTSSGPGTGAGTGTGADKPSPGTTTGGSTGTAGSTAGGSGGSAPGSTSSSSSTTSSPAGSGSGRASGSSSGAPAGTASSGSAPSTSTASSTIPPAKRVTFTG
jgi:RNA polymerase sigma factor (sigma-70 family)